MSSMDEPTTVTFTTLNDVAIVYVALGVRARQMREEGDHLALAVAESLDRSQERIMEALRA